MFVVVYIWSDPAEIDSIASIAISKVFDGRRLAAM